MIQCKKGDGSMMFEKQPPSQSTVDCDTLTPDMQGATADRKIDFNFGESGSARESQASIGPVLE